MKQILLAVAIGTGISTSAFAQVQSCQEKIDALVTQLAIADNYNNKYKAQGIESALASVRAHCTDAKQAQKADAEIEEKKLDVQKRELELKKAQRELAEARADGRPNKIADKQEKVLEKEYKLRKEKLELEQAKSSALIR